MNTSRARPGPNFRSGRKITVTCGCLMALSLLLPQSAAAEYRIPDITTGEASPPPLAGTVTGISGNLILVRNAGDEISVITTRRTHLFTHYGGLVRLGEICPQSPIEVWFRSPDANPRIAPAVSIRVPATC